MDVGIRHLGPCIICLEDLRAHERLTRVAVS